MPRGLSLLLVFVCPTLVFACNDDVEQAVPEDVCYSGTQWIGGRRGSPHMYPGRDCVGCHIENDGPQLMLGGTVYAYTEGDLAPTTTVTQSGEDCFGEPGVNVQVTGFDGQLFDLTTNEAGNFFVEGNPEDLVKPFRVQIKWEAVDGLVRTTPMGTQPSYGGCAKCHTPGVALYPPRPMMGMPPTVVPADEVVQPANSKIGLPGNFVDIFGRAPAP
jgi:hypothetical protein